VSARRFTSVVALLILAAFGWSALSSCSGWNQSAAVRASCCDTSACDQTAADDCCAKSETQHDAETLAAIAPGLIPAFHVVGAAEPLAPLHGSASPPRSSGLADRDPYLLFSVFLV
jgi:hypothetical protein